MDGLLKPTTIPFEVPAIPKRMLENARWYIDHQATHVYAFRDNQGNPAFLLLSKSAANGATQINQRLRQMFHKALCGEKDGRIKDLDTLIGTCQSMHMVCAPADGYEVLECSGNPCMYDCPGCKSFKGVGICSHVLAINHIVQKFNVRYELKSIQTTASKKAAAKSGKYNHRPLPALKRAHVPEPDSSDEEAERLLALGREGK